MPRKILPAIRRLAPGPEEKEEEREKKMERMVKLVDVLAIINAGMFDLRSSHDNIALQEAIRSLPTVDVDLADQGKKMPRLIDANEILKSKHQHYNPMADEYYVPVFDIENAPTVDAVPLEDYKSMEQTVNKLTKALAKAENKEFTLYADKKPIVTIKDSKIVLHGERREDEADRRR